MEKGKYCFFYTIFIISHGNSRRLKSWNSLTFSDGDVYFFII